MNINNFILLICGILYISLGSWEVTVINNKINTINDSSNSIVSVFIILKMLFNILWGCYCILLALLLICTINIRENILYLNDTSYGCINFIIGIFGLIEYYYNNSNIIHAFKKVLYIEMIIFYIIYGIIICILISYSYIMCFCISSTINIIEHTSVQINNTSVPINNNAYINTYNINNTDNIDDDIDNIDDADINDITNNIDNTNDKTNNV